MNIMMFGHNGSSNRGCEAIVQSSCKIIKKSIRDCKINVASLRPETDTVLKGVDKLIDGRKIEIKRGSVQYAAAALRQKLFKDESYALRAMYKTTVNGIKSSDVCLSIGGDAYCYGEEIWMYELDRNAKRNYKKLVLWNASIGDENITDKKLRDLQSFDLIIARESLTYQVLKNKGLKNVRLCADSAFLLDRESLPLPKGWKSQKMIGLNFSPLLANRNSASEAAIKELIKHIFKSTNFSIILIPHVMEEGNDDYEILKSFFEEFKASGRILLLPNNLTAAQYKGYIARTRFFIGSRTHATIAAYSCYVPTLVLGYSIKSKGIAKDLFGEEKMVLGIEEIAEGNKLISHFEQLVREEKAIKKRLEETIPKIKDKAFQAAECIKEII